MKRRFVYFIGMFIFGLTLLLPASGALARAVPAGQSDVVATSVYQTVQAMITPTATISIKALKIAILVNQTLEAYLTGTPTPQPVGNLETAVYGTIDAMKPTPTLSTEGAEIATAVHQTVQAFLPTPTPTMRPESVAGTALAATIESLQRMMTATKAAAAVEPTKPIWAPPPVVGPISTPVPCESFRYVMDVTIPDGAIMAPGQSFQKTWRIQNSGSCVWSTAYQIVFARGDQLNAPAAVSLTRNVNPGETIDITVPMAAPMTNGTYRGNWLLKNPSGQLFGMGAGGKDGVWVDIRVQGGGSPPPSGTAFACQYIETRYDPAYVIDSVYKVYVKNTGTAVWSKTDVDLVFVSADGPDADYFYGNIGEIKDLPRSVAPGEIVEIGEFWSPVALDYFKETKFLTAWRLTNNSDTICVFNGLSNITGPY